MTKPKIESIVAQLPVLDFIESRRFYIETLECTMVEEFEDLMILLMDGIELHLWKCDEKLVPENSSIYVRIPEVDLLFEHYQTKLYGKIQISNRPWGMREFYIIDPSGNLLKFGAPVEN
jgi:extradiol dioxygenase family protein